MSTGNTQLVGRLVTAGCMVLIYCKRKVLLVGSNTWQDIGLCCSVVVVIIYYCNVGNPLAFAMGRYPSSQLLHTGGSTPVLWHQKLVLHFASLHSREKWAPECHGQPVVDRIFCGVVAVVVRSVRLSIHFCIHDVKNELLSCSTRVVVVVQPIGDATCHGKSSNILQTVCWYKVAAKPASVTSLVPMNRPSMFQLCIYGSNSPLVKDLGLFF